MSTISSVNGSFVTRLFATAQSRSSGAASSSSASFPATVNGIKSSLRSSAQGYVTAVSNLNQLGATINETRSILEKLGKIVDKVARIAQVASKSEGSRREKLNEQYRKLATDYKKTIGEAKIGDTDLTTEEGIKFVFEAIGLNQDQASSLSEVFSTFVTPGTKSDLSDLSLRGKRPIRTNYEEDTTVKTPQGTFAAEVTYTPGGRIGDITTGDFNGDGNQDYAYLGTSSPTSTEGSNDTYMNLRLGNGDGTFSTYKSILFGSAPFTGVETSQVYNNSGRDNITMFFSQASPNRYFSLGLDNSSAGYQFLPSTFVDLTLTFGGPSYSTADLDGDGDSDLAITDSSNDVYVYRNNGGTFTQVQSYSNVAFAPSPVIAEDLTGDGKVDLFVYSNVGGPNAVRVYAGNGNGTFSGTALTSSFTTNINPSGFGDFDGDSYTDLIGFSAVDNSPLLFYRNNGNGTFAAGVTIAAIPGLAHSIESADYDEDGKADLLVRSATGGTRLLKGNGNGTFSTAVSLGVVSGSTSVEGVFFADFNNDGALDIVTSYNRSVGIRLQDTVTTGGIAIFDERPPTELDSIFNSQRSFGTKGQAQIVYNDAKVIREQIRKNIKALDKAAEYVGSNIELVRTTALVFLDIAQSLKTPVDADALAREIRAGIGKANPSARSTIDTLNPLLARSVLVTA